MATSHGLRAALFAFAASLTALALPARAVNQPDGTTIPVTSALQDIFTSAGEPLNAVTDAAVMPERFVPGCRLTFTLTSRGAALFQNSFGWYNVTGSAPAEADLHVLIPCTASTGFTTTLDLRSEPAYRGGEIGFFLRTPQSAPGTISCNAGNCCAAPGNGGFTYYTEREFNPDSAGAGSYIHLLIYDSRTTAATFYFAWEDLYTGGDNNFADFVAKVGNIVCSGAGGACDTGQMGVCAEGTQQCRSGALQCVGLTAPSAERCDGLDNDCNGMTDEGDGLCPPNMLCERGTCVGHCVENGCFPGYTCSSRGTCVEDGCESVTCDAGQVCHMGTCVEPCANVVCPTGQVCRVGRCVDPCAGMMCDADQVCEAGVCVPMCPCRRCADGQTCTSDGHCIATGCAGTTCGPGQVCHDDGSCHDACEGARCPLGQACVDGNCTEVADAGAGDGGPEAGDGAVGDGGMDGGRDGGDAAVDGGGEHPDSGPGLPMTSSCGCRAAGSGRGAHALGLAVVALALAAARRRRRGGAR